MGEKPTTGARITVNITPATMAALDLLSETEEVSITEALRRLVGYGALLYDAHRSGHRVLIDNGRRVERVRLL
jgi:Ribbon-helix-helix protein, copG family